MNLLSYRMHACATNTTRVLVRRGQNHSQYKLLSSTSRPCQWTSKRVSVTTIDIFCYRNDTFEVQVRIATSKNFTAVFLRSVYGLWVICAFSLRKLKNYWVLARFFGVAPWLNLEVGAIDRLILPIRYFEKNSDNSIFIITDKIDVILHVI